LVAWGNRTESKLQRYRPFTSPRTKFTSIDAVIDDPAIDLIYIALPPEIAAIYVRRAIEAGKSVLLEKPGFIKKTIAESLCDAAFQKGVHIFDGHWQTHTTAFRDIVSIENSNSPPDAMIISIFQSRPTHDDHYRTALYRQGVLGVDMLSYGFVLLDRCAPLSVGRSMTIQRCYTPNNAAINIPGQCPSRIYYRTSSVSKNRIRLIWKNQSIVYENLFNPNKQVVKISQKQGNRVVRFFDDLDPFIEQLRDVALKINTPPKYGDRHPIISLATDNEWLVKSLRDFR